MRQFDSQEVPKEQERNLDSVKKYFAISHLRQVIQKIVQQNSCFLHACPQEGYPCSVIDRALAGALPHIVGITLWKP